MWLPFERIKVSRWSRVPLELLHWADAASSYIPAFPSFFIVSCGIILQHAEYVILKRSVYKKQQVSWSLDSAGSSSATLSYPAPFAECVLGREGAIPEGTNPDNLNSTNSFASSSKEWLLRVVAVKNQAGRQVPSAFQVSKVHTERSACHPRWHCHISWSGHICNAWQSRSTLQLAVMVIRLINRLVACEMITCCKTVLINSPRVAVAIWGLSYANY